MQIDMKVGNISRSSYVLFDAGCVDIKCFSPKTPQTPFESEE